MSTTKKIKQTSSKNTKRPSLISKRDDLLVSPSEKASPKIPPPEVVRVLALVNRNPSDLLLQAEHVEKLEGRTKQKTEWSREKALKQFGDALTHLRTIEMSLELPDIQDNNGEDGTFEQQLERIQNRLQTAVERSNKLERDETLDRLERAHKRLQIMSCPPAELLVRLANEDREQVLAQSSEFDQSHRYSEIVAVVRIVRAIAQSKDKRPLWNFQASISVDENGQLRLSHNPAFEALDGVEAARIQECPVCLKVFWASPLNKKTCDQNCSNALRNRIYRANNKDTLKRRRIAKENSNKVEGEK